jgi:negative modulator of initiation of replication
LAEREGPAGPWNSYREEEAERNQTLRISTALRQYLDHARGDGESDEDLLWRLLGWSQGVEVDPTTSQLYTYLKSPELHVMSELTERYLAVLGFLYKQNGALFEKRVLPIRKRQRVHFAKSEKTIRDSGVSTQAKQIPGSKLWALTNMRADRKKEMLGRVLAALDYGDAVRRQVQTVISLGVVEQSRGRIR